MLLNPAGGTLKELDSREVLDIVEHRLALAGHDAKGWLIDPADLDDAFDQALAGDAEAVMVGGGDGTVSAAAARLIGSDKALGILPLGTMNLFARGLSTPLDLHHAVDALAHGVIEPVNVGDVNGRIFLHHVSFGVHPTMLRWRSLFEGKSRLSRWMATPIAWALTLRRYRRMAVRLTKGGQDRHWRTPLLVVTPEPFVDGGAIVPVRGESDAGRLTVYGLIRQSRLGLARAALAAVTAGWNETRSFERVDAEIVTLDEAGKRTPRASIDGELATVTAPVRCTCRPGALRIVKPVTPQTLSTAGAPAPEAARSKAEPA